MIISVVIDLVIYLLLHFPSKNATTRALVSTILLIGIGFLFVLLLFTALPRRRTLHLPLLLLITRPLSRLLLLYPPHNILPLLLHTPNSFSHTIGRLIVAVMLLLPLTLTKYHVVLIVVYIPAPTALCLPLPLLACPSLTVQCTCP